MLFGASFCILFFNGSQWVSIPWKYFILCREGWFGTLYLPFLSLYSLHLSPFVFGESEYGRGDVASPIIGIGLNTIRQEM